MLLTHPGILADLTSHLRPLILNNLPAQYILCRKSRDIRLQTHISDTFPISNRHQLSLRYSRPSFGQLTYQIINYIARLILCLLFKRLIKWIGDIIWI